jgi:hypothetical protein
VVTLCQDTTYVKAFSCNDPHIQVMELHHKPH